MPPSLDFLSNSLILQHLAVNRPIQIRAGFDAQIQIDPAKRAWPTEHAKHAAIPWNMLISG